MPNVEKICEACINKDKPSFCNNCGVGFLNHSAFEAEQSLNTLKQLKDRTISIANKLDYYGTDYHKHEIQSIVNELRQLSK
jgi:hypothetical protein